MNKQEYKQFVSKLLGEDIEEFLINSDYQPEEIKTKELKQWWLSNYEYAMQELADLKQSIKGSWYNAVEAYGETEYLYIEVGTANMDYGIELKNEKDMLEYCEDEKALIWEIIFQHNENNDTWKKED